MWIWSRSLLGHNIVENLNDPTKWGKLEPLVERLSENSAEAAIYWCNNACTANELLDLIEDQYARLAGWGVGPGDVVLLKGDYSPATVAVLLALIARNAIVVPLLPTTLAHHPPLIEIADPAYIIEVDSSEDAEASRRKQISSGNLYDELRRREAPGLVLFTSGSTGEPKGVVHDFNRLLKKFHIGRSQLVTLNFLLFDHWGGLNTLLHCLFNGSPLVLPENRSSEHVCKLIERHGVELLPATPTFLNMLLISRAYQGHDLTSLKLITYGAEPMPESTLQGLRTHFPNVEARQTYGLIELGVLRTKSRSSDSLWVKMGGEGYDLRVVDGLLQIKAESAMLGYLNAPSPFTDDDYFRTGDRVEVDGEYMRVLGRESELINVGGEKVYPAEVETALLECDIVDDAVVYGESNPIMGQIVCADIRISSPRDEIDARALIKTHCRERLSAFKVPVKVNFVTDQLHGDRFKRLRRR